MQFSRSFSCLIAIPDRAESLLIIPNFRFFVNYFFHSFLNFFSLTSGVRRCPADSLHIIPNFFPFVNRFFHLFSKTFKAAFPKSGRLSFPSPFPKGLLIICLSLLFDKRFFVNFLLIKHRFSALRSLFTPPSLLIKHAGTKIPACFSNIFL